MFSGVTGAFNGDAFLFVSEDGTVSGWRGALGTTAETTGPGLGRQHLQGRGVPPPSAQAPTCTAPTSGRPRRRVQGRRGDVSDLTGSFTRPGPARGLCAVQRAEPSMERLRRLRAAERQHGRRGGRAPASASSTASTCEGNFIARVASVARSKRRGGWRSRRRRSAPGRGRCWSAISATGASPPTMRPPT